MVEARAFTWGVALGAAVMYFMDPRQGGARRARIRDKSKRAVHELEAAAVIGARDMSHRAQGFAARLQGRGAGGGGGAVDVSDEVLVERVRSALGRACSHPHAIRVVAKGDGCVELVGPILASEVDDVLSTVSRIAGVSSIDDDLDVHDAAGDVPALQGEGHRRSRAIRFAPSTKLGFGSLAAVLAFASLLRGHPFGFLLGGVTTLAVARSMTARGAWQPLRALGRRRRARRDAIAEPAETPQMPDRSVDAGFVDSSIASPI
jgi:hypothetical protein